MTNQNTGKYVFQGPIHAGLKGYLRSSQVNRMLHEYVNNGSRPEPIPEEYRGYDTYIPTFRVDNSLRGKVAPSDLDAMIFEMLKKNNLNGFNRIFKKASEPASEPASKQPASKPASEPASKQPASKQPASEPASKQPASKQPASEPASKQPASQPAPGITAFEFTFNNNF